MARLGQSQYIGAFAETPQDVADAQALRGRVFRGAMSGGLDVDEYDDRCQHFLIRHRDTGTLVCCYRVMCLKDGTEISQSYSARYYDLSKLRDFDRPMVELGRFCVSPEAAGDADILRLALAALGGFVEAHGAALLFGCSSFDGTEADPYQDAFALLTDRHLAPQRWLPRPKAPAIVRFAQSLRHHPPNLRKALRAMPPLLRSYLAIGGWVSDHAVIDRDLNTMHVFTGVEISAIPAARAKVLLGMA